MVKGMSTKNNIQDYILNTARKDKIDLTIYLLNGVPLKGKVYSFDNFTIIIENDGKQQLIYKHAVSTIIPLKPIKFAPEEIKEIINLYQAMDKMRLKFGDGAIQRAIGTGLNLRKFIQFNVLKS